MMELEESNEMLCEENKANLEKKKGRRFKTASQVQALEEFYNEHKYPTESMKAEVAERIGLMEKQVSGWFCHRRLKDKRLMKDATLGTGKQDLSSGVVQDCGSGLRQDSCGSTKQTDHGSSDLREVESCRLSGKDLLLTEVAYDQRQRCDASGMDGDTSSQGGSDSREEEGFFPQRRHLLNVEISQHMMSDGSASRARGRTGPSGYLKIKGKTENAAITAVKRHLGSHYREDGPPLGVDFESLPPGAFDFPTKHTAHEPYRVRGPILQKPLITAHSRCIMNPDSGEESSGIRTLHKGEEDNRSYPQALKSKGFVSPSHSNPYAHCDNIFDYGVRTKLGLKASRPGSFPSQQVQISAGNQIQHRKKGYVDPKPKVLNRKAIREPKALCSTVRRRDSPNSKEETVPSSWMGEELTEVKRSHPLAGELYRDKRSAREHPTDRVKRGRDEVPFLDQSQWKNPSGGSVAGTPCDEDSGDDTAETGSSVD